VPEGVAETGDGALRLRARERADAIARLRFPVRIEGAAVSICFTLKPPPGAQRLDLSVGDPDTNQRYAVMLTTLAGFFANRGGFYNGATVGIPGEALRSDVPNLVRLAVDPGVGMAVMEVNGREVLRQIALTAHYSAKAIGEAGLQVFGDVVWEVSNLVVRTGSLEATPEEEERARAAGAAREEAFGREHHVRAPHPRWFNSLHPGAAVERHLRRPRPEDAVHHRPRQGLHAADARRRGRLTQNPSPTSPGRGARGAPRMPRARAAKPAPQHRSANGTSASVGRAGRITRSNIRNRSGWTRTDRGGSEERPIHAQGQICLVSADRS
jgi:hypothetical protein